MPRKTNVVEVKRNGGGAFQPFQREEKSGVSKANNNNEASAIGKAPSSPPVPATSYTEPVRVDSKKEEKGDAQRKQRRCWSQELHKRFLHALQQLGGADCEYLISLHKLFLCALNYAIVTNNTFDTSRLDFFPLIK